MELHIAYKDTKQTVLYKSMELDNLNEFVKDKIRAPVSIFEHPKMKGIFCIYHERKPSDPKDENFYIRNFTPEGKAKNKIIYGNVVFVKRIDNDKIADMSENEYQKLLKTFKNFSILKEYINGGNV